MKDELQGKLVEILSGIQGATSKASDFALSQLPDIVQSYVLYGRVSSLLAIAVGLLLIAVGIWLVVKGWRTEAESKKQKRADDEKNPGRYHSTFDYEQGFGWFMASIVPLTFGVIVFIASINNAMLVWFAPKVWLLKALASLIR